MFNSGKTFVIQAAAGSALELGMGRDMSIEFKKGFTTPTLQRFQHDLTYSISAENAIGTNSLFSATSNNYPVTTTNKTGCSSIIVTPFTVATVLTLAFVVGKIRRKENN